MKPAIYSSLAVSAEPGAGLGPVVAVGSGDQRRYQVSQSAHAGIKQVKDRPIVLVLDAEEALDLCLSLAKMIPVGWLEENKERVRPLAKILEVAVR